MEFSKESVPNGFYRFEKPGCDGYKPIVHVMEIRGERVVSFLNRDYPTPLRDIPSEIKFVQSPINSNFDICPEEIEGREEELAAYLLEYLMDDKNLQVTRGDKQLCISRASGKKRHYFILNINLETIEEPADEESHLYLGRQQDTTQDD